jgi:hypothetical protein
LWLKTAPRGKRLRARQRGHEREHVVRLDDAIEAADDVVVDAEGCQAARCKRRCVDRAKRLEEPLRARGAERPRRVDGGGRSSVNPARARFGRAAAGRRTRARARAFGVRRSSATVRAAHAPRAVRPPPARAAGLDGGASYLLGAARRHRARAQLAPEAGEAEELRVGQVAHHRAVGALRKRARELHWDRRHRVPARDRYRQPARKAKRVHGRGRGAVKLVVLRGVGRPAGGRGGVGLQAALDRDDAHLAPHQLGSRRADARKVAQARDQQDADRPIGRVDERLEQQFGAGAERAVGHGGVAG